MLIVWFLSQKFFMLVHPCHCIAAALKVFATVSDSKVQNASPNRLSVLPLPGVQSGAFLRERCPIDTCFQIVVNLCGHIHERVNWPLETPPSLAHILQCLPFP